MKKILFLLLLSVTAYGQVPADATPIENIQLTNNVVSTGAPSVVVQETNGVINKINKGDVIEYLEFASAVNLPVTGVSGKLYLTRDNNRLYRWNGTIYVEVTVDISGKENTANKQNSLVVDGTGVKFPTVDAVRTHTTDTNNPHAVTKAQVGLANVDNTSDLNKPISTATQTALNGKQNTISGTTNFIPKITGSGTLGNSRLFDDGANIGTNSGNAFLIGNFGSPNFFRLIAVDGGSFVQYAAGSTTGNRGTLTFAGLNGVNPTLRLLPSGRVLFGDIADNGNNIAQFGGTISHAPAVNANQGVVKSQLDLKADLASPTFTGTVNGITKAMVGLGNVDNTSDLNKPISTATQTALNLKADLASPFFTGTLSAQVGNFSGALQASSLAVSGGTASQFLKANGTVDATVYAPLASPELTGTPTAPTATAGTNTTQIATTAFVTNADSGNVKITGNQSISGTKTFTDAINIIYGSGPTINFTNNSFSGSLKFTDSFEFTEGIYSPSFIKSSAPTTNLLLAGGGDIAQSTFVQGSGTTNFLPKFTASGTIGNSSIREVADRVIWIGEGSTDEVPLSILSESNISSLGFKSSTTANAFNVRIGASGEDFIVRTLNIERFRVASSGNTLFGTTTDNAVDKLQVNGNITASPAVSPNQVPILSQVATLTGNQTLAGTKTFSSPVIIPNGVNPNEGVNKGQLDAVGRPYKVYTALLSQSGTAAPTAVVLENTLGGSVVWTRVDTGRYVATLTGAFTVDKTIVFATTGQLSNVLTNTYSTSVNTVSVDTFSTFDTASLVDGAMRNAFEIRVYN